MPIVLAFTLWIYQRTTPAVSTFIRVLLLLLRGLVLVILALIIFNPQITIISSKERLPELALLIDASGSMQISDKGIERANVLKSTLNEKNIEALERNFRLRTFLFSDSVQELDWEQDTLAFSGIATDIADAVVKIENILEGGNSAILLLSDGAYNVGADPVRLAQDCEHPVFTVGVGDSSVVRDLSITEIQSNPLIYLYDDTQVSTTIEGYPGAKAIIKLISPTGKVICQKDFEIPSGSDLEITSEFSPDTLGTQVYSLIIEPLTEDYSSANNSRHFAIKVLQSKLRPLIVAGSPSPEVAFIRRILERNPHLETTLKIQVKGGDFKTIGKELALDDSDVLILVDFPTAESPRPFLQQIINAVENDIPLILLPSMAFRAELLKPIAYLLPGNFGRRGEEISVKLAPETEVSPLLDFFPPDIDWNSLAPVKMYPGLIRMRDEAQVLARTHNNEPAIAFINTSGRKILLFGIHDLWRLSLQDPEHSQGDSLMSNFWQSSLRWLSSREEQELFQVSTGGKIFSSGEQVAFKATLYDASLHLKSGAKVILTTESPDGEKAWEFIPQDPGHYECRAQFFQEGICHYQAYAIIGKDTLRTKGDFMVETFNPEYLDSRMRPEVLRAISNVTSGKFYLPSQFEQFLSDYKPSPEKYLDKKEFRLFPRWGSLLLIIALLTLEWMTRKWKGML